MSHQQVTWVWDPENMLLNGLPCSVQVLDFFYSTLKLENKYFMAIFCLFVADMFEGERHSSGLGLWLKPHLLWLASPLRPYKASPAALTPCTRGASAQVGWGEEMGLCRKVTEEKVQPHKYSRGPKIPKFSVARKTAAIKHVEKLSFAGRPAWFSSFSSRRFFTRSENAREHCRASRSHAEFITAVVTQNHG